MSRTTPNLGLTVWSDVNDPFSPTQLAANWDAIDAFSAQPRAASSIQNGTSLPGSPTTGTVFYLTAAASGFAANTLVEYTGTQWQVVGPRETLAAVPSSGNYTGRTVLLSAANGGFTQWSLIFYDGAAWQKVGGIELLAAIPVTNNYAGRLVLLTSAAAPFEAFSLIAYNGSSWSRTEKRGVEVGTTLPGAPYTGQIYYVTAVVGGFQTGDVIRWNGSAWQQVSNPQYFTNSAFGSITSPADGYLAILQYDSTSGTNYTVRYNAGSSSSYKWEVVGGPSFTINANTTTVLRAGDYNIFAKGNSNEASGTTTGGDETSTLVAGSTTIDTSTQNGASTAASGGGVRGTVAVTLMGRASGLSAGATVSISGGASALNSKIVLMPIRIS